MPLCVYCAGSGLGMGHGRGWVPCPAKCPRPAAPPVEWGGLYEVVMDLLRANPGGLDASAVSCSLERSWGWAKDRLETLHDRGRVTRHLDDYGRRVYRAKP